MCMDRILAILRKFIEYATYNLCIMFNPHRVRI